MVVVADELWTLVLGRPQIDPDALAAAIVRAVLRGDLDFRTRLLIRDALEALLRRNAEQNWYVLSGEKLPA